MASAMTRSPSPPGTVVGTPAKTAVTKSLEEAGDGVGEAGDTVRNPDVERGLQTSSQPTAELRSAADLAASRKSTAQWQQFHAILTEEEHKHKRCAVCGGIPRWHVLACSGLFVLFLGLWVVATVISGGGSAGRG